MRCGPPGSTSQCPLVESALIPQSELLTESRCPFGHTCARSGETFLMARFHDAASRLRISAASLKVRAAAPQKRHAIQMAQRSCFSPIEFLPKVTALKGTVHKANCRISGAKNLTGIKFAFLSGWAEAVLVKAFVVRCLFGFDVALDTGQKMPRPFVWTCIRDFRAEEETLSLAPSREASRANSEGFLPLTALQSPDLHLLSAKKGKAKLKRVTSARRAPRRPRSSNTPGKY